jgi:type II secretory pathway component GspD/PulD (secretin)
MPKPSIPQARLFLAWAIVLSPLGVIRAPAAESPDAGSPSRESLPAASVDREAELARLRALPPSHIPLKGATLASAIRLLAESAQMSYLAPPEAEFGERVTSDVMMNPFDMLEILGENFDFGIEYERGIWRFYRINLNELVTKTYTLRFNNLQEVSINSSNLNSQLAAFNGGGSAAAGAGGSPGGLGNGTPKDTLDAKTSRVLEDIRKILGIPTVGLTTPSLENGGATPGAGAARKGETAPKIEPIWNPDTSQLFVVATRQQHSLIAAYLKTVDRPQKLVRISVKFVETARNPQQTFGVDWSQTFLGSGGPISLTGATVTSSLAGKSNAGTLSSTTSSGSASTTGTGTGSGSGTSSSGSSGSAAATPNPLATAINLANPGKVALPVALLSAPAFQLTMQAIAQDQQSSIVQDPVIYTTNNREVTFKATTEQPIQEGSTTFGTATAATTSQIAYIEVGTELTVLPSVMPGSGRAKEIIQLSLSINVSSIIGTQIIGGNPYPITSSRSYSYSVSIPNGETLAIAGLEQRSRLTSDSKVPLLGDIPLLGYAFKSKTDNADHTTLLAFITPELVHDAGSEATAADAGLPEPRHRVFQGTAGETLAQVGQSLKGIPEDLADLQRCANGENKTEVLNRLDRIGVELALIDVRLGELSLTGVRLTGSESAQVQADEEKLAAVRASVADVAAE